MAAFEFPQALDKRQYNPCRSGQIYRNGRCYERGAWYWWGRWVLAAVVVGISLLILIMCMSARRRKRRGVQPFYGTGWMGGNNKHHQHQQGTYAYNQQYNGQQQGYAGYPQQGAEGGYPAPPPAYGQAQQNPQYTGSTFNPNDGYYGGHNEGIHLQQPQNSYQRDVYSPPAGPPPGK